MSNVVTFCINTTKCIFIFFIKCTLLFRLHFVINSISLLVCVGSKLIDQAYSPFHAVLRCGNLTSDVQVFPRPEPVIIDEEVDPLPKTVQTGMSRI